MDNLDNNITDTFAAKKKLSIAKRARPSIYASFADKKKMLQEQINKLSMKDNDNDNQQVYTNLKKLNKLNKEHKLSFNSLISNETQRSKKSNRNENRNFFFKTELNFKNNKGPNFNSNKKGGDNLFFNKSNIKSFDRSSFNNITSNVDKRKSSNLDNKETIDLLSNKDTANASNFLNYKNALISFKPSEVNNTHSSFMNNSTFKDKETSLSNENNPNLNNAAFPEKQTPLSNYNKNAALRTFNSDKRSNDFNELQTTQPKNGKKLIKELLRKNEKENKKLDYKLIKTYSQGLVSSHSVMNKFNRTFTEKFMKNLELTKESLNKQLSLYRKQFFFPVIKNTKLMFNQTKYSGKKSNKNDNDESSLFNKEDNKYKTWTNYNKSKTYDWYKNSDYKQFESNKTKRYNLSLKGNVKTFSIKKNRSITTENSEDNSDRNNKRKTISNFFKKNGELSEDKDSVNITYSHPEDIKKFIKNHKRTREFYSYMNERYILSQRWKLVNSMDNATSFKFNNVVLDNIEFQSNIIKDEMCLLLDNIKFYKGKMVNNRLVLNAFENQDLKFQVNVNKSLEEICALIHLIPKIILKEYYFYTDRFISIAEPSNDNFLTKEVTNESECFVENIKLLIKVSFSKVLL